MGYREYSECVLKEIHNSIQSVSDEKTEKFVQMILRAEKIFCDGKGRSGLVVKGFAMRLAQMGLSAYDPQGVTTPAIQEKDLLIVASGSGETPNLIEHVKKTVEIGADVVLITANKDSVLGTMSEECFELQAQSKTRAGDSIQPMGTLFEQSLEVFFDIIVLILMKKMSKSNEEMLALHNNLE